MPVHTHPASRRRLEINTPRENSFTDSDRHSLTPNTDSEDVYEFPRDQDGAPVSRSPIHLLHPTPVATPHLNSSPRYSIPHSAQSHRSKATNLTSGRPWSKIATPAPKDKFRTAVRKIIVMHRSATLFSGRRTGVGAEPGVDPRRLSADVLYRGIRQECAIEVIDYSSVRCRVSRMANNEFSSLMEDPDSSERESWVKVRWINIGGLSWDVIKILSMKYGMCITPSYIYFY
jgi:hypothetical protein